TRPARGTAGIRNQTRRRSAENPERGTLLDAVVRERRPLQRLRSRTVRLQPVDALAAHLARNSAPARCNVCSRGRDVARRTQRRRTAPAATDVFSLFGARIDVAESG